MSHSSSRMTARAPGAKGSMCFCWSAEPEGDKTRHLRPPELCFYDLDYPTKIGLFGGAPGVQWLTD